MAKRVRDLTTMEGPVAHHDEFVPPCFPQKQGKRSDGLAVPLPFVEVKVSEETRKFDTLKLNPSSALSEGKTGPAKVFNRLIHHKESDEVVDAMTQALTNSSIVMALILTISIPSGESLTPAVDTIWGSGDSKLVEAMINTHDLIVAVTATACIVGLLLAVALLDQISRIPKASVAIYMVKIGPGKAQAPDLMWRIICLLFLLSIFLKISLTAELWVSWTWIAISGCLVLFVLNTVNHGAHCLTETVHVMANPDAYAYDPSHPGKSSTGFLWGCLGGDPNAQ
eukprot:m.83499 g.83499  ORF g.83499 m.83499 type:complete len:282 (-) comp16348_c0_seq1:1536-2381(-)